MLTAHKTSMWKSRYEIALDGAPLTELDQKVWTMGARFALNGSDYEIKSNMWGSTYGMSADGGETKVATAEKVGRKHWAIEADGRRYEFTRTKAMRGDQALMEGDREIGTIRRPSVWKSDVEAELDALPEPVAVFALAVVIATWEAGATTAATVSAAT